MIAAAILSALLVRSSITPIEIGSGVREATILRVRAYRATLFVERRPASSAAILTGDAGAVRVEVEFLRDVDKRQGAQAWAQAIAKSAAPLSAPLAREVDALERWIPDVKKGDRLTLEWDAERGAVITSTATRAPLVASVAFGRAVLSMWIGSRPVDQKLKAGMLSGLRERSPP